MKSKASEDEYTHYEKCFLCERQFQYGPHRYAGRSVGAWKVLVCENCEKMNWDGLVPDRHPRLIRHLKETGVEVQPNERGWLPIPQN